LQDENAALLFLVKGRREPREVDHRRLIILKVCASMVAGIIALKESADKTPALNWLM
jgi:hypothetical protein